MDDNVNLLKNTIDKSYFYNYIREFDNQFLTKTYISDFFNPCYEMRKVLIGVNNDETYGYDEDKKDFYLTQIITNLNNTLYSFKDGLPVKIDFPITSFLSKNDKRLFCANFNVYVRYLQNTSEKKSVDMTGDFKIEKHKIFFLPFKSLVDIYSDKDGETIDPTIISFDKLDEYFPELFKSYNLDYKSEIHRDGNVIRLPERY